MKHEPRGCSSDAMVEKPAAPCDPPTSTPAETMPATRGPPAVPPAATIEKYGHLQRCVEPTRSRASFADRLTPRTRKKLTPAEKATRKENRDKHQVDLNVALGKAIQAVWQQAEALKNAFPQHDTDYYFKMIIQNAHTRSSTRKVSLWNVFVFGNKGNAHGEEEPDDASDHLQGAPLISRALKNEWKTMTAEEKIEATKDSVKELEEFRVTKALAVQNVSLNSFHDSRANLTAIEKMVAELHQRTGTEVIFIAVRSSQDDFLPPRIFATSDRVSSFFESVFHRTPIDFGVKLEAFLLSGVQGVVANYQQEILILKHKISDMILRQLQLVAKPDTIHRMNYANFASEITAKFGVICEGWPLDKFSPPSTITSRMQLDILCQAWETGVASFRKLSKEEYEKWSSSHFQAALQRSQPQGAQIPPPITQTDTSVIAHEANTLALTTPAAIIAPSTIVPETIAPTPDSFPLLAADPTASTSVMSVSGTVLVAKKTRKQRSDKGKPRGPRQRKGAPAVTTAE